MKSLLFTLLLLAGALPASRAAEFAPDYDYISEQMMPFFEGKTPRQIAPYLSHFNSNPYNAAVRALAAHGKQALPLVEKLLTDTNPWLRGGAVHTLGMMFKYEGDGKTPRPLTADLQHAIALASRLLDDPHPAVQQALGQFVQLVQVETPQTQRMAVFMAASTDPGIRAQANRMARYLFKDPATIIKICTTVGAAPDGNTPSHWNVAYMLIKKHKDNPLVRQAFPSYAHFLCHKANSRPYRGFFSDGAQNHMMEVLLAQWDDQTEQVPDLIPGLCRAYVRVPYHDYPGWVKTRKLAMQLLRRCTARSVPAIRTTIAEEKQWLQQVDPVLFKTTTEFRTPIEQAKKQALQYIADLENLADQLERQSPRTGDNHANPPNLPTVFYLKGTLP